MFDEAVKASGLTDYEEKSKVLMKEKGKCIAYMNPTIWLNMFEPVFFLDSMFLQKMWLLIHGNIAHFFKYKLLYIGIYVFILE